jgi:tryptophan-rich sensory protein
MKNWFNWKIFIISLVIVYLCGAFGGFFASAGASSQWFNSIKPDLTPPSWVFLIVWNVLFFLIAFSFHLAWIHSHMKEIKFELAMIFGVNLILNALWNVIFFGFYDPKFAFFELWTLWISITLMMFMTARINKFSSLLLSPYLLWVSFAGILNYLVVFQ